MPDLRRTVLELLAAPNTDRRLGGGVNYFLDQVRKGLGAAVSPHSLMETCWQLVSDGLVFIDISQDAPTNWAWTLTERGLRAVTSGRDYEPDDPDGYITQLDERLSGIDAHIRSYATEAVRSYAGRCYLASAVMLGVASEAALVILFDAFAAAIGGAEGTKLAEINANVRLPITAKFAEFRKRFEPRRNALPQDLADGLSIILDGVADLIRVSRNDSGHPTGRVITKDQARVNLQMFGPYLERLDALRRHYAPMPGR